MLAMQCDICDIIQRPRASDDGWFSTFLLPPLSSSLSCLTCSRFLFFFYALFFGVPRHPPTHFSVLFLVERGVHLPCLRLIVPPPFYSRPPPPLIRTSPLSLISQHTTTNSTMPTHTSEALASVSSFDIRGWVGGTFIRISHPLFDAVSNGDLELLQRK